MEKMSFACKLLCRSTRSDIFFIKASVSFDQRSRDPTEKPLPPQTNNYSDKISVKHLNNTKNMLKDG